MGTGCSNTATLTNAFAGSPTDAKSRQYDIKVTQIPCGAAYAQVHTRQQHILKHIHLQTNNMEIILDISSI